MEYLLVISMHFNGTILLRPISDPLPRELCEVISRNVVVAIGSVYCVEKSTFIIPFTKEKTWEFKSYEQK